MITVLGLDPGTSNMAWSVVDIWGPTRFRVRGLGMVQRPLKDMKGDMRPSIQALRRELNGIIKKHNVTHIGAERFQARGLKGNTGELVAFMLGIVSSFKQPSVFITASQWKNNFNKHCELKALYKETVLKPHEVDACSIAVYVGLRQLGHKDTFSWLRLHSAKYQRVLELNSETLKQKLFNAAEKKKAKENDARQKKSRTQGGKPSVQSRSSRARTIRKPTQSQPSATKRKS